MTGVRSDQCSRAPLPVAQYQRVFRVLETCDAAQTLDEFKELVLDSLGSSFGYRNMTCFTGPSIPEAFHDRAPSLRGHCNVSWPDYGERWHRLDVLSTAESRDALTRERFSELERLTEIPEWGRQYIDGHMRKWGYRTSAAMHLEFPHGGHALIGLTDPEPDMIGRTDAAALGLLARHLSTMSRRMPSQSVERLPATLSNRMKEVAALIGAGRSNKEIASTLYLSLDTVKKYVSRTLASTDCRSRAEFIARYR